MWKGNPLNFYILCISITYCREHL